MAIRCFTLYAKPQEVPAVSFRRRRAALEDENLCADASPQSGRYLVRDPADCRMFYSCTPAEEAGRFIPHRVACPEGTGA